MSTFVRVAAVLVGLANAVLYGSLSSQSLNEPFGWDFPSLPISGLYALCAIIAGLFISEVVIRFARRTLQERFFARYGLMVLALCVGGAIMGALLTAIMFLFDDRVMAPGDSGEIAASVAFATIPGGVLGAVEGVIPGFPLAAMLGLFRGRS